MPFAGPVTDGIFGKHFGEGGEGLCPSVTFVGVMHRALSQE
jgi:hypothetical protein